MSVNINLHYDGMIQTAKEFCALIEQLEDVNSQEHWIQRMGALLPQLHSSIVLLHSPTKLVYTYPFENDDTRCELFMRLNEFFLSDQELWPDFEKYDLKLNMCESLAYDFTDMYFDIKWGLNLLEQYPQNPHFAASNWRSSFLYHWGQQLVDAEGWLYALGIHHSNSCGFESAQLGMV